MREIGLWDVNDGLDEMFGDIERYFGKCEFSDCQHKSEPNCAIKSAIESGELSLEGWESYLSLKRDVSFSENKAEYLRQKSVESQKSAMWWKKQE